MCRSIKVLRNGSQPASPEDIDAAALQFVRKISGFTKPSKKNEEAFFAAVAQISQVSKQLLVDVTANMPASPERTPSAVS